MISQMSCLIMQEVDLRCFVTPIHRCTHDRVVSFSTTVTTNCENKMFPGAHNHCGVRPLFCVCVVDCK